MITAMGGTLPDNEGDENKVATYNEYLTDTIEAAIIALQGDSDTFTRANSATTMGTTFRNRVWDAIGGTWGITSNTAYLVTSAGANANASVIDMPTANLTVKATFSTNPGGGGTGLVGRLTDISNMILVLHDGTSYFLYKRVAGSFTSLGSYTVAASNGDIVELVMSNNSLSMILNGVVRIGPVTESFNNTATKVGLFSNGVTTPRWDDFNAG